MKRQLRTFLLIVLSTLLLTVSGLADSGPKPQLTIRVENAPKELYYLDLLEEDTGDSLHKNLQEEDLTPLDDALLVALQDAVPDGWHACLTQGTRAPLWGSLTPDETGLHSFGYVGLPSTYRILLVTQSGENWISAPLHRSVLQSSVTVDWAHQSVSVPPVWLGYGMQFISTLLPTLLIEGLLLLAFGYHLKKSWRPFLLVNLLTQGALAAYFSFTALQNGVSWWYIFSFVPAEVGITLVEALLYARFLTEHTRRRGIAYAITANLLSAALGLWIAAPVWHFIVSNS